MRRIILFGIVVLLLGGACAPAASPAGQAQRVQVELGEFYFKPATLTLPAGQTVQLELVNRGRVEHEFMVGLEARPKEHAEAEKEEHGGYMRDFFEGIDVNYTVEKGKVEQEAEHGFEVELEPGGRALLTFTIPADRRGTWEIGCFVPGHYEAGMKATLIVR